MRTRDFASDTEVAALVSAFENTIPASEFTHAAHIAVALSYVAGKSDVDLPLWRRINLIVEDWTKRRPIEAHYSTELIKSQAARDKWVPPDRLPIPF